MSQEIKVLLEAFDHLPEEDKNFFTREVLRRSLPFDSGPLEDEEIGSTSSAFFKYLDEQDADATPR
jgi:hypothetical protein